jgi:hypothetical protein
MISDDGSVGCIAQFKKLAGSTMDLAMSVSACRGYFLRLSQSDKREWWAQHMYYAGYELAAMGTLVKGQKLNQFCMEHPGRLRERISNLLAPGLLAHAPNSEMYHVCARFMVFVCGGHVDTVYDQAIRSSAYVRLSGPRTEDFDVNIPAVRAAYSLDTRYASKACVVRDFLEGQRRLSLILPDSSKVVLPFRTNMCTHLYLVGNGICRAGGMGDGV